MQASANNDHRMKRWIANGIPTTVIVSTKIIPSSVGEMADLEDCYWLDIVRVPIPDVLARRLRVVTPT